MCEKKQYKILIVDDESITALDLKIYLEDFGYAVSAITSTGNDAIKKAEKYKPDLVLMDIVLKGEMDGIEAANEIRNRFDIPAVYLTAFENGKLLNRAKMTTPYGYIVKPFEKKELNIVLMIALQQVEMTAERKKAEALIKKQKKALEIKNIALKELIEQISIEKDEVKKEIAYNINKIIIPQFESIRKKYTKKGIELLHDSINDLASDFGLKISSPEKKLSPREIEIANLVRNGVKSTEIAKMLKISKGTVEIMRKNMRKKLGISKKKINLRTYLQDL